MNADLEQHKISDKTKLEQRGTQYKINAPVTCSVSISDAVIAGFGDGTVRFFRPNMKPDIIEAHKGVVLCMANNDDYIFTGGEDGRFLKISSEGKIEEITNFNSRWVDTVAVHKITMLVPPEIGICLDKWSEEIYFFRKFSTGGLAFDSRES